jgi:HEAT repeat protein
MASIGDYFRRHRWQRRLLTLLGAAILAGAAALAAFRPLNNRLLVRELTSGDPARRQAVVLRIAREAADSESSREYFRSQLDDADDLQFMGLAAAMQQLGCFYTPTQPPQQLDRYRTLLMEETRGGIAPQEAALTRRLLLVSLLTSGRDNEHIRRAAVSASRDEAAPVRVTAAMLAGRLADSETLGRLLEDEDREVASTAALAAGLAGMKELTPQLRALLAKPEPWRASSAAYALAKLDPARHGPAICSLLTQTQDELLRDRLLHVTGVLNHWGGYRENYPPAGEAVKEVLAAAAARGELPPGPALTAASVDFATREAAALAVLEAVAAGRQAPVGTLRAAILAADKSSPRTMAACMAICRGLWAGGDELTLILAIDKLRLCIGAGGVQDRRPALELLRQAAEYRADSASQPSAGGTPVASAQAAVVLAALGDEAAPQLLEDAAGQDNLMAADQIAWRLPPHGADIARAFLPRAPRRQYNDHVRVAGALMLARQAWMRGDRENVLHHFDSLTAEGPGSERDPTVLAAINCGRLLLGDSRCQQPVRLALVEGRLPARPAIAALTLAGDRFGLDWLLLRAGTPRHEVSRLLLSEAAADAVLEAVPEIGTVVEAAYGDVLAFQTQILQTAWAIRGHTLEPSHRWLGQRP